ncbi:MAG: hypothetical protein V1859_00890 [archaeon]
MGFVRKTTTLFLMFLLTVSLVVFGLSTLYYQKSLSRLISDISVKNDHIKALDYVYNSLTENHTKLTNEYMLKVQREQELSGEYLDVKSLKEDAEKNRDLFSLDLNKTRKELSSANSEITRLEDRVFFLEEEAAILEDKADNLSLSLADVIEDAEDICDEIKGVFNLTECKKY